MALLNRSWIPTPLVRADARTPVQIADPGRTLVFPTARVFARLGWWAITMVWFRIMGWGSPREYGRRFRLLLEDLGGLWVKLGQLLSLRVDLFPLEFCRELSQLQMKAIGFPPAEAVRIIEEDLGGALETFFRDFEMMPAAAASIGQVHIAHLRDSGLRVAVKVQRPRLPGTFTQQFRVIRGIVKALQLAGFRVHMRWEDLVWELHQIMLEELDYRFEASSTRRMRRTLKEHGVYAPKVFHGARRVLVTEFIEGVLMSDYIRMIEADPVALEHWRQVNGVRPRELGRRLVLSLLRQQLEDNHFHGDLHPGNIVLLRDNRVALIDFGTCSFSERATMERFRLAILALGRRDYAKAADMFMLLVGTLPRDTDTEAVREAFLEALCQWAARTPVRQLPYHDKSIAQIYNEVLRILYEHHCTMEWGLLRIRRALETLDASLIHLLPDADYSEIAATYGGQAAGRQIERDLTGALKPVVAAAKLAADAGEIGTRVADYAVFQAEILRRHMRMFQEASNKSVGLLRTAVSQAALVGFVMTIGGIAVLLAQRQPQWLAFLGGDGTERLAGVVPRLDWQVWAAALALGVYTSASLARLGQRLRRHERRSAERVAVI